MTFLSSKWFSVREQYQPLKRGSNFSLQDTPDILWFIVAGRLDYRTHTLLTMRDHSGTQPGASHPVASSIKKQACFCLFGLWPKVQGIRFTGGIWIANLTTLESFGCSNKNIYFYQHRIPIFSDGLPAPGARLFCRGCGRHL